MHGILETNWVSLGTNQLHGRIQAGFGETLILFGILFYKLLALGKVSTMMMKSTLSQDFTLFATESILYLW
jgi:hypothetical protein